MQPGHQKIIDSIIQKASRLCPNSLALIAVYGSVLTGDTYEHSDLDLMILINDDRGRVLSDCFILDDQQVGYDIYCTTWDSLQYDATCRHAHLSKLLDAKILYTADSSAVERLNRLKAQAMDILQSDKRFEAAACIQDELRKAYADAMTADTFPAMRARCAHVISLSMDMLMIRHGRYFQLGVKRTFEELAPLSLPEDYRDLICRIICAESMSHLQQHLTDFLRLSIALTSGDSVKVPPCREQLAGTYEEMFSNWRNKMYDAAHRADLFSSFMNMASLQFMLDEIHSAVDITHIPVMADFNSDNLTANAEAFDKALASYLLEYGKAGIRPKHFADADAFSAAYLR